VEALWGALDGLEVGEAVGLLVVSMQSELDVEALSDVVYPSLHEVQEADATELYVPISQNGQKLGIAD
jgi:hypothetical protein